ncbi:hypothetical protein C8Q74DRAFT_1212789 [Fomes fomentarius]|nr:hypothetical protein C8Q74DRAFT_1212789 [Fomes fomentarius]
MAPLPNEPDVPKETLLIVGPILFGALASWLLFGISIVQLYLYYIFFPNDKIGIKALVYWVFTLDILLTVIAAGMGWHILVAGWGRQSNLIEPGWTFAAIAAGDGIIAMTVQLFYAWRIWILKRWRVIPGLIVLIALAQSACAISIAAGIPSLHDVRLFNGIFYPRTSVWLAGGAVVDILIAASMFYVLSTAKKATSMLNRGDRAINRLIALSVETGSLSAATAILELIFFLAPSTKNTDLHILFSLILGKIYSSAMMTSLNSRIVDFGSAASGPGALKPNSGSVQTGATIEFHRKSGSTATTGGARPPVVRITQHTEVYGDDDRFGKNPSLAEEMEFREGKPRQAESMHSFSPI